jgi:anaerobic selenocysteine-containing dehydrogenase
MIGGKPWGHDFANSKYILVFGWDIVGKGKVVWARAFAEAKRKGAKIVSFNPWKSAGTSAVADESISIRPGSDLAVANAMIHVILAENLYNKEFVEAYTNFPQYETRSAPTSPPTRPSGPKRSPTSRPGRSPGSPASSRSRAPASAPLHKKTPTANYANGTETTFAITS